MDKRRTTLRRRGDIPDIPLRLDRSAGDQVRQVHAGLRAAILEGRFEAGARLPSSRALAGQIGVGRNAVVVAYEHLQGDGLLEARPGAGTYVAARLPTPLEAAVPGPGAPEPAADRPFVLGRAFADPILLRRFATAMKRRILKIDGAALGYGDPRGSAALRREVAVHLAASRGIRCDPGRVLVVGGLQQGLRLCAEALLRPGDRVWFEDPGYPAARRTLMAADLRLVPIPVDAEGLDVAAGRRAADGARAVYVTPSNQFPTGAAMSMERRIALLDWARASGAWVLEDDYDNEFRYEGPPLTALAGIGGDRVIYFGTFSKALFPGLRLAYLVLPPGAAERVVAARAVQDRFPPALLEGAVADLMADGTVATHTRRARARYRAGREALRAALASAAGDALRIVVPRQGLHVLAYLPGGLSPADAARIRDAAGVEAWLVSDMRLAPGGREGFVLGFAGHDEARLTEAAEALGRAARRVVDATGPGPSSA